jgi:hypothetical protein
MKEFRKYTLLKNPMDFTFKKIIPTPTCYVCNTKSTSKNYRDTWDSHMKVEGKEDLGGYKYLCSECFHIRHICPDQVCHVCYTTCHYLKVSHVCVEVYYNAMDRASSVNKAIYIFDDWICNECLQQERNNELE